MCGAMGEVDLTTWPKPSRSLPYDVRDRSKTKVARIKAIAAYVAPR